MQKFQRMFISNCLISMKILSSSSYQGLMSLNLPGWIALVQGSPVITNSITFIAQKCISKGYAPSCWKEAKVNPLYKGGAKDEINNYRPMSILPILSKLLEKFIQQKLIGYLNEYDVLHQSQSGFCSGHSTETALTLMTERWLKEINDGNIIGTIMVDF